MRKAKHSKVMGFLMIQVKQKARPFPKHWENEFRYCRERMRKPKYSKVMRFLMFQVKQKPLENEF